MKKAINIILVLIIITQVLCACSNKSVDNTYSSAIQGVRFSAEDESVCFTRSKINSIILETNSSMTNLGNYSSSGDYGGMNEPYIYNGKLYYITSSLSHIASCIASLDINNLERAEILTPEKRAINSFTVFGNHIYYSIWDNNMFSIYSFNLKTKKEERIFSTDEYDFSNFFVSNDYIIGGNTRYDLNKKQSFVLSKELNDKLIYGLGIINDIYYCSYRNYESHKDEVYSIDLKSNTFSSVCELPIGLNPLRLYDGKILFVDANDKDPHYLKLSYYDLDSGEEKIAFDKTSDCYYYGSLDDHIEYYDCFYYNESFYMWYPETIVKINNKNEDKTFGLKMFEDEGGGYVNKYSWLTYDEYLEMKK